MNSLKENALKEALLVAIYEKGKVSFDKALNSLKENPDIDLSKLSAQQRWSGGLFFENITPYLFAVLVGNEYAIEKLYSPDDVTHSLDYTDPKYAHSYGSPQYIDAYKCVKDVHLYIGLKDVHIAALSKAPPSVFSTLINLHASADQANGTFCLNDSGAQIKAETEAIFGLRTSEKCKTPLDMAVMHLVTIAEIKDEKEKAWLFQPCSQAVESLMKHGATSLYKSYYPVPEDFVPQNMAGIVFGNGPSEQYVPMFLADFVSQNSHHIGDKLSGKILQHLETTVPELNGGGPVADKHILHAPMPGF